MPHLAGDDPRAAPLSRRGFFEHSLVAVAASAAVAGPAQHAAAGPQDSGQPAGAGNAPSTAAPRPHPLDPLSEEELKLAVRILRERQQLADSVRFVSAVALEPDRAGRRAAARGASGPRQAFLVLRDRAQRRGYEAVVDLEERTVARFTPLAPELQPAIMLDEFGECEQAVKRSELFRQALARRGVTNVDLVMVEPWSAGHYGTELPEDAGRRLLRALCFVRSEPNDNGYARPLDGVVAVVDLDQMEVLRVEDHGVVPLPPESGNWAREYFAAPQPAPNPLEITQPAGPGFRVEGHAVRWHNWSFRLGFTPREGLVIHDARFADRGRERPVLARAAICEMVVPYGDPGEQYYRKNAFDIGEYGIGTLANSLKLGCDCLGTIRYFDAHVLDSQGAVTTIKNAICLHEEDVGLLWKHTDWRTNQSETRRARRLSCSFVATVGNYEYAFYWHFHLDGTIQCEVKLTGIMNTTALPPGQQPSYGVLVAPQLNAPYHQHIFAARLDVDIDGGPNTVEEVNIERLPRGPANPHGNAFRAVARALTSEAEARRSVQSSTARYWRVVNRASRNALGQPLAYRLVPGENGPPFVQPDAAVMRRAGFAAHNLWVTPYARDERYPAGDYPNQHPEGDGLPRWTAANRAIENTDLVVWYVFSHAHVPRVEDWPVMPASSIGFMLKPDGFFDRNPAIDLAPPDA